MRLFRQLLLLMLALALGPTAIFGWMAIRANRDSLVTNALEMAGERVERLRLQVGQDVVEATAAVERVAATDLDVLDDTALRALLARTLGSRPDLSALTLIGPAGERLPGLQAFPAGEIVARDLADHDREAAALLGDGPGVGVRASPIYVAPRREPALTVVVATGGRRVAAVAAEIRLGRLQETVARQRVGLGRAYVVDAAGRLLAHPEPGLAVTRPSFADRPVVRRLLETRAALEAGGGAQVGEFVGPEGEPLIAAFTVVPRLGLGIIYEQSKEAAYAQVAESRNRALVGLLFTAVVAALLAAFSARNVVSPIREVVEGALQIARGNFGSEVKIDARNELGDLAHTFNYMSRQLRTYDAENKELVESLERGYMETITALANAVDSKDPYTRGHSQRVADLARATGEVLGLAAPELKALTYGGILHDVGKIGIPEAILLKQSRLSPEEMKVMRQHPVIGANIVGGVKFLAAALPCVRNHHERWDGHGYPDSLLAEDIPLVARIVNCADTYDAITSTRPYQKAAPAERALEILESLRNKQIDGKVLDAFVKMILERQARGLPVSELDDIDPFRRASNS